MIVRILGEGQLDVPEGELESLNALDDELQAAVEAADEMQFTSSLTALLNRVREVGRPIPDDEIVTSELVLPAGDTSLAEARELLGDEGLIPG
ncbi:MAG TPA: hypothetical protein VFJ98_02520 [Mycobacteriales bacterium]|nr:hypothetical protein [Mycobacteriales bacterium]